MLMSLLRNQTYHASLRMLSLGEYSIDLRDMRSFSDQNGIILR